MKMSYKLTQGTLDIDIIESVVPINELLDVAERENPKRAFIFASKVIGRYIPTAPSVMHDHFSKLANKIPQELPGPVLFIGLAEAAITLSSGIHREYINSTSRNDCVLLTSTRHPLDGHEVAASFLEEHSHASGHLIHQPITNEQSFKSVVIVDDEITTGSTIRNLFSAIKQCGLADCDKAEVVTLTDWSVDQPSLGDLFNIHSLARGRYNFSKSPGVEPPKMPSVGIISKGDWDQENYHTNFGRLGIKDHDFEISIPPSLTTAEKVLVIGLGEFTWLPFMLAELIEHSGKLVDFISITRSPIFKKGCITSKKSFSDNYGIGISNYLYNVHPEHYDAVLVCSEAQEDLIDKSLLEHFDAEPVNMHSNNFQVTHYTNKKESLAYV